MKKLMIAAAIVCAAVAANAAAVTWNSGAYSAGFVDHNGNSLANSTAYTMTVTFFSDSAGKTQIASSSADKAKANGSYGAKVDSATYDFSALTTYYVSAVITGEDKGTTWTREAALTSFKMAAQGDKTINFYTGAGFQTESLKWGSWSSGPEPEPTPEPTSALLMLLGVAGLALRRKQK